MATGLRSNAGDATVLRAPFWLPREWEQAAHVRRAALYLNHGYPLVLHEDVDLGTSPRAVLPPVQEAAGRPLAYRVAWTQSPDGVLHASLTVELPRGDLSSADTPVFQQRLRALQDALAQGALLHTR